MTLRQLENSRFMNWLLAQLATAMPPDHLELGVPGIALSGLSEEIIHDNLHRAGTAGLSLGLEYSATSPTSCRHRRRCEKQGAGQATLLQAWGCPSAQGHLLSQPLRPRLSPRFWNGRCLSVDRSLSFRSRRPS
ncbi:MAG: hypothetical protein FD153_1804 [Rhodospirillaceae bacterium]|nr:MAG: hypothetical protein FD153_1804 [Rhodospirillaceae bacterium]